MRSLRALLIAALAPIAALPAQSSTATQSTTAARLGVPTVETFDVALPAAAELPAVLDLRLTVDGVDRDVRLWRHSNRVDEVFEVVVDDGTTAHRIPAPAARTYRGRSTDGSDLSIAASLEPEGLWAMVLRSGGAAWAIQPLRSLDPRAPRERHVGYPAPGMSPDACGVIGGGVDPAPTAGPRTLASTTDVDVCEIAFDCDHDLYQFLGASAPATVAAVERTLDAVNLMYEREVSLTHAITHIVVRTAEPDPYSGNDAGQLLNPQFRDEWRINQASVRRDVAHFMTSRSMGNILGLAYVGVVCSRDWGYGLNQLRSNHGTNASVLGHELGHNWSLPHCLDPNDIMCGGGINGGFGPNNRVEVASHRATRDCLEPDLPELVAHWRLDETAGPTAADSGPGGHDGTWNGGTPGVPGAANGTAVGGGFDGVDDHVRIPGSAALAEAGGAFSVAVWVNPSAPNGWQRYLGNSQWSLGQFGQRITLAVDRVRSFVSNANAVPGRWTHIVATCVADRGVEIFVDGQPAYFRAQAGAPPAISGDWFLGAGEANSEPFAGQLDDVQVYRGALNAGEAAWLFAHPGETARAPGWSSYGTGLAGTLGVPSLGVSGRLRVGSAFTLDVGSSSGMFIGRVALAIGFAPATTPLLGGTLLVDVQSGIVDLRLIGPTVTSLPIPVPNDPSLAGNSIFSQALQIDAGAPFGLSMSPGVEIVLGG